METLLTLYAICGLIVSGICAPVYYQEIFEEEEEDGNYVALITAVIVAFALWPYVIYRDWILEKKIAEENGSLF